MTAANTLTTTPRNVQVLETPAPTYFSMSPLLEGSWASWLVTALSLGQSTTLRAGAVLHPAATDLYIVLSGCVVVTVIDRQHTSKPLFVTAMQCGDIIIRPRYSPMEFIYTAKGDVQLLHIHGPGYHQFKNAVKNSEAGLMAAELTLLALHGAAAHSLLQDEKSRLLRVAQSLAGHPEVPRTRGGVMVYSTKEELLCYAGIFNRRIGARAFKDLSDAGLIVFEGYKRFQYRTSEDQL
jgi:CRP-like cAMP-binding protein